MERTNVAGGLDLGRLGPTTEVPAVQGQVSSQQQRGKARRRPALSDEDAADLGPDQTQHQIDSLA